MSPPVPEEEEQQTGRRAVREGSWRQFLKKLETFASTEALPGPARHVSQFSALTMTSRSARCGGHAPRSGAVIGCRFRLRLCQSA